MPAGRPSKYTRELADKICERIATGASLREICELDEFPSRTSVFRWLQENEQFRDQYAKAREDQADALFDEVLEIADDSRNDWMERNDKDNSGWVVNGEAIARARLRVDARKWMAGKLRPKKYGEKLQVGGDPDAPPVQHKMTVEFVDNRNKSSDPETV